MKAVAATVSGSFDNVQENVGSAIEGKGLVISAVSKVSEMLDRTAAVVGAKRKGYGQGEVFEFRSASVSRQIKEADPRNSRRTIRFRLRVHPAQSHDRSAFRSR